MVNQIYEITRLGKKNIDSSEQVMMKTEKKKKKNRNEFVY